MSRSCRGYRSLLPLVGFRCTSVRRAWYLRRVELVNPILPNVTLLFYILLSKVNRTHGQVEFRPIRLL